MNTRGDEMFYKGQRHFGVYQIKLNKMEYV